MPADLWRQGSLSYWPGWGTQWACPTCKAVGPLCPEPPATVVHGRTYRKIAMWVPADFDLTRLFNQRHSVPLLPDRLPPGQIEPSRVRLAWTNPKKDRRWWYAQQAAAGGAQTEPDAGEDDEWDEPADGQRGRPEEAGPGHGQRPRSQSKTAQRARNNTWPANRLSHEKATYGVDPDEDDGGHGHTQAPEPILPQPPAWQQQQWAAAGAAMPQQQGGAAAGAAMPQQPQQWQWGAAAGAAMPQQQQQWQWGAAAGAAMPQQPPQQQQPQQPAQQQQQQQPQGAAMLQQPPLTLMGLDLGAALAAAGVPVRVLSFSVPCSWGSFGGGMVSGYFAPWCKIGGVSVTG